MSKELTREACHAAVKERDWRGCEVCKELREERDTVRKFADAAIRDAQRARADVIEECIGLVCDWLPRGKYRKDLIDNLRALKEKPDD